MKAVFLFCIAAMSCSTKVSVLKADTPNESVQVSVECGTVLKEGIRNGVVSANLCWLLDSEKRNQGKERSFAEAIKALGAGSLRFPYGHLADNYLWNVPSDSFEGGLTPKIASDRTQPAGWDWAVNPDGTFIDAMDFDEYMKLCSDLDIVPLVVVNALSYKYKGGPTLDELVRSAKNWVLYAKSKGYKVGYWQIGNEADHHADIIPMREYVDAYKQIASAMKEADPQIKTGPGIIGKAPYFKLINDEAPELIDFTSSHQYMWAFKDSCATYEDWLSIQDRSFVKNVKTMSSAVTRSGRNMDIVVTETGVTGSGLKYSDVYSSMWWFEVAMQEIVSPHVAYIYFWGTHSPWDGEEGPNNDIGILFSTDDNSSKPIAEISSLINTHIRSCNLKAISSDRLISAYAFTEKGTKDKSLFLMNKYSIPQKVSVTLQGTSEAVKNISSECLYGKSPYDRAFDRKSEISLTVSGNILEMVLPPYSVTAISIQ